MATQKTAAQGKTLRYPQTTQVSPALSPLKSFLLLLFFLMYQWHSWALLGQNSIKASFDRLAGDQVGCIQSR